MCVIRARHTIPGVPDWLILRAFSDTLALIKARIGGRALTLVSLLVEHKAVCTDNAVLMSVTPSA